MSQLAHAQAVTDTTASDTMKLVEIINADKNGFKRIDSVTELQILVGHAIIKQGSTTFYFDSAVYNKRLKTVEAFGNIHINDRDSIHTYSQYLLYHTDTKVAFLKKKVKLTDNKSTLYTEDLVYDINQKLGEYKNGGRVVNGSSVLTSKEGTYYADLKDIYFKRNVKLKDPKYNLETDSLLYNTNSEIATFIDRTKIVDSSKREIITREGFYDLKNKKAVFGKRPTIKDGATQITANDITTDDETGISILKGNAVYKDTAQGVAVLANLIEANKKEGNFRATLNPLMIIKQEEDSIYIAADTLFSGKLSKLGKDSTVLKDTIKGKVVITKDSINNNDSTDRYFKAYRNVRIFSDSLQAVADSLFYSGKDSIFRLMQKPIVWGNTGQITGDTILLYTKNKKADKMEVFEKGMLISDAGSGLYNQIKGNRIYAYFKEGNLDYVRAKGNAESIYIITDDKDSSLIGINRATGDIIDLRFVEKKVNRVVFVNDVKGTMYPIKQVPEESKRLPNFQWHEKRRPKTKYELFGE
ncbi:MAG: hypothetical protein K2P88_05725 [Chitinophagaceae bacterium]|nr:hypothetical protein [Chitinophagaceae bacterium]